MGKSVEKVALVTGGSSGIGKAICEDLLKRDFTVITLARRKTDIDHARLVSYQVDLVSMTETKQVASDIAAQHNVTHLVNNAGVIRADLVEDVSTEDLMDLTQLHMGSALILLQAVLPAMKAAQYGRVVNMSSRAIVGLQGRTSYASTKAAMVSMTRTWALELGQYGVTVNAIAPGPVVTEMFTDVMPEDGARARALADSLPVKRLGTAEDIANATWFFLSPEAGFVTGQTLFVCGGASIGSVTI